MSDDSIGFGRKFKIQKSAGKCLFFVFSASKANEQNRTEQNIILLTCT